MDAWSGIASVPTVSGFLILSSYCLVFLIILDATIHDWLPYSACHVSVAKWEWAGFDPAADEELSSGTY